jgi:pyocin large subunit-like protein
MQGSSDDSNKFGESEETNVSQPIENDIWLELDEYNNPTPEILPEAQAIANGHAYNEHIEDFPGIETRSEFAQFINNLINNPSEVKPLNRGRTAYWDDTTDTVIIVDPSDIDGGTAFKPTGGKDYFDTLE